MPFRPPREATFTGIGLGLHFLLGNVLAVCPRLEEMWFGWRAIRIFPEPDQLAAYCRTRTPDLDLFALGDDQKIRFWFSGIYADQKVCLELTDTLEKAKSSARSLAVQTGDHLAGFREEFIEGVSDLGIVFSDSQKKAALWPEKISWEGLDAVGRALEAFYLFSYGRGAAVLDLRLFEEAAAVSPFSFLALDLLGWAHFRRSEYGLAKTAFKKALAQNPSGPGAMAGLVKCAERTQDLEAARYWSEQKARIRL